MHEVSLQDKDNTARRRRALELPTPSYLYDAGTLAARCQELRAVFAGRFEISYAVKANPNRGLLRALAPHVQMIDVSAFAEVERVRAAGLAHRISFTGPGKRDEELHRFAIGDCGEIVLESLDEAETLSALILAQGLRRQKVLMRINPSQVPRNFGASMSGKSSQFGIDEEEAGTAIAAVLALPGLELVGFHCYSATNALKAEAVAANFLAMATLFRFCVARAGIRPELLVFGSGFGIPYFEGEVELALETVAATAVPMADALRAEPAFRDTRFALELGRWIVGPAGVLLTRVIRTKTSRGTAIKICDAGFNANMAACGMLGGAFRRNWRIENLTNPEGAPETCDLVGPLCTTLDHVATGITLPEVRKGDMLAIACSGAYGISASPTRFISHPEPSEFLLVDGQVQDITESRLNWWSAAPLGAAA